MPIAKILPSPSQLKSEPKPHPERPSLHSAVRLNRNFMNYPLARSARTEPRWHDDRRRRDTWCRLPGDDRIELSLPTGSPVRRRLPTGFDMDVLFRLLAAVQARKQACVEFASRAAFLRELQLTDDKANRERLERALQLWQVLTVRYRHWYLPGDGGKYIDREFPPPIKHYEFRGNRLVVTLDRDWVNLAKEKYYEAVPLPLPHEASAQNFVLMVLTNARDIDETDGAFKVNFERVPWLCRKIGLRKAAREWLERAAMTASAWFKSCGGVLKLEEGQLTIRPEGVVVTFFPPKIPRRKKGGSTVRTESQKGGSTVRTGPQKGGSTVPSNERRRTTVPLERQEENTTLPKTAATHLLRFAGKRQ